MIILFKNQQIIIHITVLKHRSVSLAASSQYLCLQTLTHITVMKQRSVSQSCCIASVTTDSDTEPITLFIVEPVSVTSLQTLTLL